MENSSNIPKNKIFKHIDKVFFILSLLYLIFVIYWINRPIKLKYSLLEHKNNASNISNSQFMFYLQQSLKVIKQTPKHQQTVATSHPIIEKVYVPIYSTAKIANKITYKSKNLPIPVSIKNSIQITSIPLPPKPVNTPSEILTNNNNIKLIGILDSGDHSAALFDIQGVVKRLQIGDNIAETGWIFQRINQQKILISKQGNIRYIEVGQTF